MKQKIVIKLRLPCEKCSSKAMALAAAADGVSSVTLEGADRDQVVVIGDGVDSASLTTSLRKKVGCVYLVSVEEVKPKPKPPEEKNCGKPKGPPPCTINPPPCGCRTSNPPPCGCRASNPPPCTINPPPCGCRTSNPPPCTINPPPCGCRTSNPPCHHPQLEMSKVVYDPSPPPCTIM